MSVERFKDAIWFSDIPLYTVHLIGCGGIGSWTAMFLSRIGFNLYIYDNDIIDNTNLSGQFFTRDDIGHNKATAISTLCDKFDGKNHHAIPFKFNYNGDNAPYDIIISAVDNIETREYLFHIYNKLKANVDILFIDGRLSAEFWQLFVLHRNSNSYDIDMYRESLDQLNNLDDDPCTFKQTSHIAAMLAANIVTIITNYITNKKSNMPICNIKNMEFNAQIL